MMPWNKGLRRPLAERFWEKVDRRGPTECWPWKANRDIDGYGRIRVGKKQARASAVALMLAGRQLQPGEWALHHCDNPACVNPTHLYAGTHSANVQDKVRRNRQARGNAVGFRRNTRLITHEGIVDSVSGWARRLGLSKTCLLLRFERGLRPPALFSPSRKWRASQLVLFEPKPKRRRLRIVDRTEKT